MELYSYFRSSAAYRVRIVLNYKGIKHQLKAVNLLKAEEQSEQYRALNPQGLVPCMKLDNGQILTQSQAIIEYLETAHPQPPLLSSVPHEAAQQRAMAAAIACDIHPLNNLRVLKYIQQTLEVSDAEKTDWYSHWIVEGFKALEPGIAATPYSTGSEISLVDAFLVPQVYNALRFNVRMDDFPLISQVYEVCNELPAFIDAAPENQPDAI